MKHIKYLAAVILLVLAGKYAYSEIISDTVSIDLTHEKLNPIHLKIPKAYLTKPFKSQSYDKVEFEFRLNETNEPTPINPQKPMWGDWGNIDVTIERTENDQFLRNHFQNISYPKRVSESELEAMLKGFHAFIPKTAEFPSLYEELRSINNDESVYFRCARLSKTEITKCRGRTYYDKLIVEYHFYHKGLSEWRVIQAATFKLIDQFVSN